MMLFAAFIAILLAIDIEGRVWQPNGPMPVNTDRDMRCYYSPDSGDDWGKWENNNNWGNENNWGTNWDQKKGNGKKRKDEWGGWDKRYYYDITIDKCKPFENDWVQSTGGEGNNFDSKEDCKRLCIKPDNGPPFGKAPRDAMCHFPKNPGTSEWGVMSSQVSRFYYNQATGKCEKFTYRGKGGNPNRFKTRNDCERICKNGSNQVKKPNEKPKKIKESSKKVKESESWRICHLPKDEGNGREPTTSYYYNASKGKCEKFTYRGRGGNANNFLAKEECEKKCSNMSRTETWTKTEKWEFKKDKARKG